MRRLLTLNLRQFVSVGLGIRRRATGQHLFDQIPPQRRVGRHFPRRPYVNQHFDRYSAETIATAGIVREGRTAARMPRYCVVVVPRMAPRAAAMEAADQPSRKSMAFTRSTGHSTSTVCRGGRCDGATWSSSDTAATTTTTPPRWKRQDGRGRSRNAQRSRPE